jgi:hypothetical protein
MVLQLVKGWVRQLVKGGATFIRTRRSAVNQPTAVYCKMTGSRRIPLRRVKICARELRFPV